MTGQGRRTVRPVDPARLERAAYAYLERFAASSAGVRRVLMRRVAASVAAHGTDAAEAAGWVEALIQRLQRLGLLNDALYAEQKAASLRRRGASARAVRATLAAKGIDADDAATALAGVDDENGDGDAELTAARRLVQRRRLGRFRPAAERAARRDRDLAALARAGFGYDVAVRALDDVDE